MNGLVGGPGTGSLSDCTGQMMGGPMMGMMLGSGLIVILLIVVLVLAAIALIKYLRAPS